MKKIIAISVMFVLLTGAVFAVDVAGTVFGHINVLEGNTGKDENGDANPITSGGGMDRIRIDGAGEAGDGKFGGYIRYQGSDAPGVDAAWAWWKPLDQLKLIIGSNSDAFWGKEGVTGWSFNQMPNDCSVALNPGIWCGAWWGSSVWGWGQGTPFMHNRYVFFEGYQYWGAGLEITPSDIASINIGLPFISAPRGKETADQFRAAIFQLNLNFDFGNIAITYDGANRAGMKGADGNGDAADSGAIFAYFGGTFGDLGLDVGLGYHLAGLADSEKEQWGKVDKANPIGVGLGVKYATDSFGVKFRVTAALAGDKELDDSTYINASVLPYFNISDGMTAFVNIGLGMYSPGDAKPLGEDSITAWYFNPYLRVGAEWGPTFYFGIQVSSDGQKAYGEKGDATKIDWAVPIALQVSF